MLKGHLLRGINHQVSYYTENRFNLNEYVLVNGIPALRKFSRGHHQPCSDYYERKEEVCGQGFGIDHGGIGNGDDYHVAPAFQALSGRRKFTVRRHTFNEDYTSFTEYTLG